MRRIVIGLILLIVLLVGTVLFQQMQTASQTAIENAVAATLTAQAANRRLDAPALVYPPDGARSDNVAQINLQWRWLRPLEDGEVFDVRVWREGEPPYGITWTTETSFDLTDWLLYQQPGTFFWTIAVLQPDANNQPVEIAEVAPPQSFTMTDIDLRIMALPPGFEAELYARLPIDKPTVITFAPDGALHVLGLDGEIIRLIDADGDFAAESHTVLFDDPRDDLLHAVGMAFHDGQTYISHAGKISIMEDDDGDGDFDDFETIIEGLPSWEYPLHSNNGIAFGSDGRLYIGVGSTTDHGPIRREYESSILRANPDGSGLEVFASGFRNPYDLAFSPDGDLFTADNSPDSLGATLQYLPPEELNHVREGGFYGFPTVYGNPRPGEDAAAPVTEFFTSSASSGLTVYAADQFPPEFRGVYVAQFGTGAPYPKSVGLQSGRVVVFVQLEPTADGTFTGTWQPFARFDQALGGFSPIDVTVGGDGALYIAEWETSTIYRVTYNPDLLAAAATPPALADADPAVIALGDALYHNGAEGAPACVACHLLDGSTAPGPSLLGLYASAADRVEGLSAEEYVRRSILAPNEHIVTGYSANFMYPDYESQLSPEQIDALVTYVLTLP